MVEQARVAALAVRVQAQPVAEAPVVELAAVRRSRAEQTSWGAPRAPGTGPLPEHHACPKGSPRDSCDTANHCPTMLVMAGLPVQRDAAQFTSFSLTQW